MFTSTLSAGKCVFYSDGLFIMLVNHSPANELGSNRKAPLKGLFPVWISYRLNSDSKLIGFFRKVCY